MAGETDQVLLEVIVTDEASGPLQDISSAFEEVQGEVNSFMDMLENLDGEFSTIIGDVEDVSTQLTSLQGAFETVDSSVESFDEQLLSVDADVQTLSADIESMAADTESAGSTLETVGGQVDTAFETMATIGKTSTAAIVESFQAATADITGNVSELDGAVSDFATSASANVDGLDTQVAGLATDTNAAAADVESAFTSAGRIITEFADISSTKIEAINAALADWAATADGTLGNVDSAFTSAGEDITTFSEMSIEKIDAINAELASWSTDTDAAAAEVGGAWSKVTVDITEAGATITGEVADVNAALATLGADTAAATTAAAASFDKVGAGAEDAAATVTAAGTQISDTTAATAAKVGTSADTTIASENSIGTSADNASKGIGMMGIAALATVGLSLKAGAELQAQTAELQGTLDISAQKARALQNAMIGLGASSEYATTGADGIETAYSNVAAALGNMWGHTLSATQAQNYMKQAMELSTATGTTLTTNTQALMQAMRATQTPEKDVAAATNELYNTQRLTSVSTSELASEFSRITSRAVGAHLSLSQLGGLMVEFQHDGVSGASGMRVAGMALRDLVSPTDQTKQIFDRMGVTIDNSKGQFIGLLPAITQLHAAYDKLGEGSSYTADQVKVLYQQTKEQTIAAEEGVQTSQTALANYNAITQSVNRVAQAQRSQVAMALEARYAQQQLQLQNELNTLSDEKLTTAENVKKASLQASIAALKTNELQLSKSSSMTQAFGTNAQMLATIIGQGPKALDKYITAVDRHNAVTKAAAERAHTFEVEFEALKSHIETVFTVLGEDLIPVLTEVAKVIADTFGPIIKFVSHNKALLDIILIMVGAFGGLWAVMKLGSGVFKLVSGTLDLLPNALEKAGSSMKKVGDSWDKFTSIFHHKSQQVQADAGDTAAKVQASSDEMSTSAENVAPATDETDSAFGTMAEKVQSAMGSVVTAVQNGMEQTVSTITEVLGTLGAKVQSAMGSAFGSVDIVPEITPIVDQVNSQEQNFADAGTNLGTTAAESIVKPISEVSGELSAQLQTLTDVLNNEVSPANEAATQLGTTTAEALDTAVQQGVDRVQPIVATLPLMAEEVAPQMEQAGTVIGQDLTTGLEGGLAQAEDVVRSAGTEMASTAEANAGEMEAAGAEQGNAMRNGMAPALESMPAEVEATGKDMESGMTTTGALMSSGVAMMGSQMMMHMGLIKNNMTNQTITMAGSMVSGMATMIPGIGPIIAIVGSLLTMVIPIILDHWKVISSFFDKVWHDVEGIFAKAFDFIKSHAIEFIAAIVSIFTLGPIGILGAVLAFDPKLREEFVRIFDHVISAIESFFVKFGDTMMHIGDIIVNALLWLPEKEVQIGKDIIDGLIRGIENGAKDVEKIASKVGHSILGGFKSFFHIFSPSQVMANEIGAPLVQGISQGVESNTSLASASINKLGSVINTDMRKMATELEKAGTEFTKATDPLVVFSNTLKGIVAPLNAVSVPTTKVAKDFLDLATVIRQMATAFTLIDTQLRLLQTTLLTTQKAFVSIAATIRTLPGEMNVLINSFHLLLADLDTSTFTTFDLDIRTLTTDLNQLGAEIQRLVTDINMFISTTRTMDATIEMLYKDVDQLIVYIEQLDNTLNAANTILLNAISEFRNFQVTLSDILPIVNEFVVQFTNAMNKITSEVTTDVNLWRTQFLTQLTEITQIVTEQWNQMLTVIKNVLTQIQNLITQVMTTVQSHFDRVLTQMNTTTTTYWNEMYTFTNTQVTKIQSDVTKQMDTAQGNFTSALKTMDKDTTSYLGQGSGVLGIFTSTFTTLQSDTSTYFGLNGQSVPGIFDTGMTTMQSQAAKSTSGIINSLKDLDQWVVAKIIPDATKMETTWDNAMTTMQKTTQTAVAAMVQSLQQLIAAQDAAGVGTRTSTVAGQVPAGTTPSANGNMNVALQDVSGAAGGNAQLQSFMAAELMQESGGNYGAINSIGASGGFQFMNPTWQGDLNQMGLGADASKYPSAASAPPVLQNQVAANAMSSAYGQYGSWGKVAEDWYGGGGGVANPNEAVSGGPTPAQYSSNVLSLMQEALKDLPHLAAGGMVSSPTAAIVGEGGPEFIIPKDRFSQLLQQAMGGRSGGVGGLPSTIGPPGSSSGAAANNVTIQVSGNSIMSEKDISMLVGRIGNTFNKILPNAGVKIRH